MIEIGALIASTAVEVVNAEIGDLSDCVMTHCVGGDRIFDDVPVSVGLHDCVSEDPAFSVSSYVLTADTIH